MDNEIVQNLTKKCETLYKNCKKEQNFIESNKYYSILQILKSENCFDKLDSEIAINLLLDLNYNLDQAIKLYSKIIAK